MNKNYKSRGVFDFKREQAKEMVQISQIQARS
jgi:hypothetical protein